MTLIIELDATIAVTDDIGGSDVYHITNCDIVTTPIIIQTHSNIATTHVPIATTLIPIFPYRIVICTWISVIRFLDWTFYLVCWLGLCAFVDIELWSHFQIRLSWFESMLVNGVIV